MVKRSLCFVLLLLYSTGIFAQRFNFVVFNKLPQDLQLYPRDEKNESKIPISGIFEQNGFEKSNEDLIYHLEMSLKDFEKDNLDIPHPDGILNIKMPNEINTNQPLRVKKKGYNGQGDLYVKMFVKYKKS
jgi:hypothetical protein